MIKSNLKYLVGLVIIGILILVFFFDANTFTILDFWVSWLLNIFYFLMIALFGNLFLSFHILANTKWHFSLEPILVLAGKLTVFVAILFIPLFWGMNSLFPWIDDATISGTKNLYLNVPFFIGRTILVFIIWLVPGFFISKLVTESSKGKLKFVAGIITVFYIFAFIVFSHDWLLSIISDWHSTLFGWFIFSGLLLTGMSFVAIVYLLFVKTNKSIILDSSRYLFTFSSVWMYLWFSQFMLIWYGNIQHETFYFSRQFFYFQPLFYANLLLSFGIPFVLLLSKTQKKSPVLLGISAVSALIGQWINLYITIYPAVFPDVKFDVLPVFIFSILLVLFLIPFILKLKSKKVTLILLLAVLFLGACNNHKDHPGYEYIPEMTYSRAFQTYSENPIFKDSATMRNPIQGTVPREMIPFQYKKTSEDRLAAGIKLQNPVDSTMQNIDEGKFLYESFCLHCHGEKGDGMGKLFTEKFYTYKPGVLNGSKIQSVPEGEIYQVISEGFNLMGPHKTILLPNERWKIVHYIKSFGIATTD